MRTRAILSVCCVVLFPSVLGVPVNMPGNRDNLLEEGGRQESAIESIYKINKEARLDLFEGDIELTTHDRDELGEGVGSKRKRNAGRDRRRLWGNRVVPYVIDPGMAGVFKPTIRAAVDEFHKQTCLRFVPRTNETNWIVFVDKNGCRSSVGKKYWRSDYGQEVVLGTNCNSKGLIMHELMHAVGFWHEQSRTDRNGFVEIMWENIETGQAHNFFKYSHDEIDNLEVPYDYDSLMHYGKTTFSKNGSPTIRAIHDPDKRLGRRDGFSPLDVHEINSLYDCANNSTGWSTWSEYGPCNMQCYKMRQRFCTTDKWIVDCPGADQYGVQTESLKCTDPECYVRVDGHWNKWSSWATCSRTCGEGTRRRTRVCDDPVPKYGGADCVGKSSEIVWCKSKRCGLGPDDCEFDYGVFCLWVNDPTNSYNFDWLRRSGTTPSKSTGPSADNTSGTGHYLYIEASSPAQPGNKARLLSQKFPATSGRCLSFAYHMYGSNMGELHVYIKDDGGKMKKIWSRKGQQGKNWIRDKVNIKSSTKYQVVFEGVRGSSYTSDIGLDDVTFKDGPCLEPIGCYKESSPPATFPVFIRNLRSSIDWWHMDKTVVQCARLVSAKGYNLFSIQFYGECWSGDNAKIKIDPSLADTSGCWNGVGGPSYNFIYRLV